MKRELQIRLAKAGFRLMHDGDQHEVIAIREQQIAEALGKLELDTLYRFHCLGAEARAQALRLTENRESFILREYVTQQVYAEGRTLDAIAEAIEKRKADQSPRMENLRELATGHIKEGAHRGGWAEWTDPGFRSRKPGWACCSLTCMEMASEDGFYCAKHWA